MNPVVSTTGGKKIHLLLGNSVASRNLRHFLLRPCRPALSLLAAASPAIDRFIVGFSPGAAAGSPGVLSGRWQLL